MIEKVRGISIQGRCFTNRTTLQCYPEENDRISVIYGKNGSGKSTISEGCSCLSTGCFPEDLSAKLIDKDGNSIELADDESVFVFDEKYIDENVKIDDDALGTIILLGSQVDLQSQIEKAESQKEKAATEYDTAKEELEKFQQDTNVASPVYHWNRIKKELQSTWAEVDSEIKGNKTRSKVTEAVMTEICKMKVTQSSASELQKDFDQTKKLLEKISDTTSSYPTEILPIKTEHNFEELLCGYLAKQIEKPVLTDREKMILATIKEGRQDFIEDARKNFQGDETTVCPYCYQPVCQEYKQSLIDSINKVLNKDVDDHKQELRKIQFPIIPDDYTAYSPLDHIVVEQIQTQSRKCSELVTRYRMAIEQKIKNTYTPIQITSLGLAAEIDTLNQLLGQLERKRVEFEDASHRRKKLTQKLLNLNKMIANIRIKQYYLDFQEQMRELQKAQEQEKSKEKAYLACADVLRNLKQKKSNEGLAINNINNSLDYVFFKKGRLSIELKNGKYYLKSNGKDVKPRNVSLGERNIIALCYFFTEILSNQDVNRLYENKEFIVIDDPVSSFDFENKIGIISFIRYQVNRIIKGNQFSKILVLSHDLTTIFDLRKAFDEICKNTKGIAKVSPSTYCAFELSRNKLVPFKKQRSEYGNLMENIYHYANGDIGIDVAAIGNMMRRALEAFSSFTYRKSIEDVLIDAGVLNDLNEHSTYFENLMCRLVLHGESHFEEQVYSLHDSAHFYQFVSDDEKQRTAKDILCFMYLLNKHHVEAYLRQIPKAVSNICGWIEKIPTNAEIALEQKTTKTIDLYDLPLSAGTGDTVFDDVQTTEYITDNLGCDFALKISGASMEPDIPDQSIVLIKKAETLEDGMTGAFYLDGKVYCKRLAYQHGKTFLCSNNPTYRPIEVADGSTLKIYGKVIEVVHPN